MEKGEGEGLGVYIQGRADCWRGKGVREGRGCMDAQRIGCGV